MVVVRVGVVPGTSAAVPVVLLDDVLRGGRDRGVLDDQVVWATESRWLLRLLLLGVLLLLLRMMDHAEGAGCFHQAQGQGPTQQEHDSL